MNAVRSEKYKGRNIRIVVLPPVGPEMSFRAMYEIERFGGNGHDPRRGVIAGALMTPAEAEGAALMAAMHSIDSRLERE